LGADADFSQLLITGVLAHSLEKNTFVGGFEFDYTADGVAPVQWATTASTCISAGCSDRMGVD
ncbi:MAG: hypothetical protein ACREVY_15535, partial [Gammaproteobacteria bacterium]